MACFYHQDRVATAVCNTCGKALCTECGSRFQPPTCMECAEDYAENVKSEMKKNIIISVVLMVVGIIVTMNPLGFLLAGIPWGWSALNKITPAIFLWLPLIGWVIYFLIKLIIAYVIGIVALPVKLYQWTKELSKIKKLQEDIANSRCA